MKKEISDKTLTRIKQSISISNGMLDNKIRVLNAQLASVGKSKSGTQAVQLNNILLAHVQEIYDIIWEGIFSDIKDKGINLNAEKILGLISEISADSLNLCEEKLKKDISINSDRILVELNFPDKARDILNRRLSEYEKNLLSLEPTKIAKSSKTISIWSSVITSLISLGALVISILAYLKIK